MCSRKTWTDVSDVSPEAILTPEEIAAGAAEKNALSKKGSQHPDAQLTEEQVREIRYLLAHETERYGLLSAIGRRYGVSKAVIGQISRRDTWTHVTGDPAVIPTPVVFTVTRERKPKTPVPV